MTGPGLNNTLYPSQDSNLSVGSAHSNDGMTATGAGNGGGMDKVVLGTAPQPPPDPSPEKMPHAMPTPRTPKERKRKRKNDAHHQQQQQHQQQLQSQEQQQQNASPGACGIGGGGGGSGEKGVKKINDYFKHTPSSPARPQVSATGSAPVGQNSTPGTPTPPPPPPPPPQGFPQSLYGHHHHAQAGALSPVASEYTMPRYGGGGKAVKSVQTDVLNLKELEDELEKKDNRIEELTRMNEELSRQLQVKQKDCDEKATTITKCLNVVKELLIEKSTIEKKDARAKCMQNRLRLGQFVTQRVGATFQENWTDGFAFQELAKRQEEINNEREEIDRKKKVLQKRKPSEPGTNNRKRASSNNADKGDKGSAAAAAGSSSMSASSGVASGSGTTVGLHNGTSSADETLFTKPPPRDGMTLQEYYEAEEILKYVCNCRVGGISIIS